MKNMKSAVGICCLSLLPLVAPGAAKAPLRMTQLDLARQMETTTFVSNYVDRVSAFGFDTLVLYLEGRVATKTFALPPDESYTPDQMRGVVAHAAERGMTVVPVVSLLGHAEQFFRHPGQEEYMEKGGENCRVGDGRNTATFCLSNPKTRAFLSAYVAELCEVFTGPYFHVGFDEAWNSGTCPDCREKEWKGDCFPEAVAFAHDLVKRHGKRMMMWDDFFGFHPGALERTPKDVVLFHWNYDGDISDRGDRFNFAGRLREDALADLPAKGYDVVPCSWSFPGNVRSFVSYARRHRVFGYLQTQWENQRCFQGVNLPHVVAAAKALDAPDAIPSADPYEASVAALFPSLDALERRAAVRLLEDPRDELAFEVLKGSSAAKTLQGAVDYGQLDERGLLDDLLCLSEERILGERLGKAESVLADPRRNDGDLAAARALLGPVPAAARRLAARRDAQTAAWRPGCSPHEASLGAKGVSERAEALLASAKLADADEKVVELELSMPDFHGIPNWTVEGRFAGEWRTLATGRWKPKAGDWANFTAKATFRSESMPERLRLSYCGYGLAGLRYVSVVDRSSRRVPTALLGRTGSVRNAAAVLRDDYETAEFGEFDFLPAYRDRRRARFQSTLTVQLGE